MKLTRTSWAALGAATAVVAGAGGVGFVQAEDSSSSSSFVSNVPCRMIDTRTEADVDAIGAGESITLDARGLVGDCEIPSNATGLSVNIAAVGATSDTFLTAFPTGAERPGSSHLNVSNGVTISNGVDVTLSADGQLDIYNASGSVDVVIDMLGAYVPSASGTGEAGPQGPKGDAGPAGEAGASFRAVPVEIEVGLDYTDREGSVAEYGYFGPLDVCGDGEVLVDMSDLDSDPIVDFIDFRTLEAEAIVGPGPGPSVFSSVYGSLASEPDFEEGPFDGPIGGPFGPFALPGVLGSDGVIVGLTARVDGFILGGNEAGPEALVGPTDWPETQIVTAIVACGPELDVEGELDGIADNNLDESWDEGGPRGTVPFLLAD